MSPCKLIGLAALFAGACATPVLADVLPGLPTGNSCGLLGGATASILLTVCGCWAVRAYRRGRR